MNARSEPLLWLQLIALGALPLEALLLLLLLAGADPGPFPGLERLLVWSLGGLAPAVLFWRLPPDLWSLLLAQAPLRARRPLQRRLSTLQSALPLRLLAASGALLLLPLIWWSDSHAGVAWRISPLASSPRLVGLMLSAALLALMLWQWQQLVQALWMLSQRSDRIAATEPLSFEQIAERRLNWGLPLLLLPALEAAEPVSRSGPNVPPAQGLAPEQAASNLDASNLDSPETSTPLRGADDVSSEAEGGVPEAPPARERPEADAADRSGGGGIEGGIAIPPEQRSEQGQGSDLDQQI